MKTLEERLAELPSGKSEAGGWTQWSGPCPRYSPRTGRALGREALEPGSQSGGVGAS